MPEEQHESPEQNQNLESASAQPAPAVPTPDVPVAEAEQEPKPVAQESPKPEQSSTVTLVWQWLTYGLWSWTLGSLGILLSSTLAYFIANDARNSDYTWLIYIIATALCLLPISFVIDRVYSKNEPSHKHGFAAVILVLHAVLAFLVSIGSLITAVVTLLSIATDPSGDTAVKTTIIVSALLIAILGGLFFVRIVRPPKLEVISRKFSLIVTAIATATIIAALVGPYAAAIKSRTDRQLESGLYGVNNAIQEYARDNKKLPGSLKDLSFNSYDNESETLVKKGLVSYTAQGEVGTSSTGTSHTFKYELCVDYKDSKGSGKVNTTSSSDYANSYLDTYSHPAGHTCYQQSAYVYGASSSRSLLDKTKPLTN